MRNTQLEIPIPNEAHVDRHNYVPLGDKQHVRPVVEMPYREVAQLADRYIAILHGFYGDSEFSADDSEEGCG